MTVDVMQDRAKHYALEWLGWGAKSGLGNPGA